MTFGESLRREREMRGIELRDVADATKISLRFLQAIEQDRPELLPGGIFPRAFVRQYARHLGLDAEKAVTDFLFAHRGPENPPPEPEGERSWPWLPLAGAGVALALVVGFAFLVAGSGEDPAPGPTPTPVAPVAYATDRVYPAPTPAPAGSPRPTSGAPVSVTLTARETCWVHVEADRVTVLNRTLNRGEEQVIEANSEVVLAVGNAGGLGVVVNGKAAPSLGRTGEVRRNIVITRDTLPAQLAPVAAPGGVDG